LSNKWDVNPVDWPKEQRDRLVLATRLAKWVVKSGFPIVMRGDPEETAEVLRTQFLLTPDRDLRRYCTFSTHADNCEVPPNSYWILGLSKRSRQVKAGGEIDVAEKSVLQLPAGSPESCTSFFVRWFDEASKTQASAAIGEKLATIQFLSSAMEGTLEVVPVKLNDEAVAEVGLLFRAEIAERLANQLSTVLRAPTSARLAAWWVETRTPSKAVCDALAIEGPLARVVVAEQALDFIVALIEQRAIRNIDRRDWAAFRKLARETEHARLLFATSVLHRVPILGWPRERDRLKALTQLDDAGLPELFDRLRSAARVSDFVCRDNTELFLELITTRNLSDRELIESLKALVDQQTPFETPSAICKQVADLPSGSARRLLRLLERWGKGDEPLLKACRKAVELNVSALWKWWRTLVPIQLDRQEKAESNSSSVSGK
jgi:hypothetical protein